MRHSTTSVLVAAAWLVGVATLQGELVFDGVILDRVGAWDGYPTITLINGIHHLYWCSSHGGTTGLDTIYHATKPASLGPGGWTVRGEVIHHLNSPLAQHLTCDPSFVRGSFVFDGASYAYALYYTFDAVPPGDGTDASVAVAFSNDGQNFVHSPDVVIEPDGGYTEFYGAGASSACWGPNVGILNTFYWDTTYRTDGLGEIRYKYSFDGQYFQPTPSLPTSLALGFTPENYAGQPDVAYSPALREWFAETGRLDNGLVELLVIRTGDGLSIDAEWSEIGRIGTPLTGQEWNIEGGLARFSDSSLYIDRQGWAYVLFGAGEEVGQGPTWKIYEVRFRVLRDAPLISDTFQHFGIFRVPDGPLTSTQTELGQRTWQSDSTLVLGSGPGKITNSIGTGSHVGGIPFSPGEEPTLPATLEALFQRGEGGWVAAGFAASATGGLFAGGGMWVLIQDEINQYEVYANGFNQIAQGPVPNLDPMFNFVRLEYTAGANSLTVLINGSPVLTSHSLGFSPGISHASVHIASPVGGGPTGVAGILGLRVNGEPYHLFLDGFETGTAGRWDEVVPLQDGPDDE